MKDLYQEVHGQVLSEAAVDRMRLGVWAGTVVCALAFLPWLQYTWPRLTQCMHVCMAWLQYTWPRLTQCMHVCGHMPSWTLHVPPCTCIRCIHGSVHRVWYRYVTALVGINSMLISVILPLVFYVQVHACPCISMHIHAHAFIHAHLGHPAPRLQCASKQVSRPILLP